MNDRWLKPDIRANTEDEELKTAPLTPADGDASAVFEQPALYGRDLQPDLSAAEGFPCFVDVLTGRVTLIDTGIFVVGFSKRCGLSIDQDPRTHTVSRFHATVTVEEDGVYICDESMNGTFLGKDPADRAGFFRLPKGSSVLLRDGIFVMFADAVFQFRAGERTPL
ncbi:MAG: FHA domain-containing protein [Firmicutes bacterium]|nr:FHA domain-containing protein [Bacillota bacterium]